MHVDRGPATSQVVARCRALWKVMTSGMPSTQSWISERSKISRLRGRSNKVCTYLRGEDEDVASVLPCRTSVTNRFDKRLSCRSVETLSERECFSEVSYVFLHEVS